MALAEEQARNESQDFDLLIIDAFISDAIPIHLLTREMFEIYLGALKRENKIPGIEEVTGGDNNSPEGKAHGFDWGFVMTFTDANARDAYLPHPDHKALSQNLLRPIVDDVLVLDYMV